MSKTEAEKDARSKKILDEDTIFDRDPNADNDKDDTIDKSTLFGEKYEQPKSELIKSKKDVIRWMNKRYATVQVKSHFRIIIPSRDVNLMTKAEFVAMMGAYRLPVEIPSDDGQTKIKLIPFTEIWLKSLEHRHYDDIVFDPSNPDRDIVVGDPIHVYLTYYNLFNGFRTKPKPGDCHLLLEHIKEVWCHNDESLYAWVIAWFAQIIKQPWKKLGSAIAVQGEEGVGKSIVAEKFSELIDGDKTQYLEGRHCMMIDDSAQLFNGFNLKFLGKLFICLEEAVFAGSPKDAAMLRSYVTRTRMHVNPKGIDGWEVNDYARYLILGNAAHIVAASGKARRWLALHASDKYKEDKAHFDAIDDEWGNGGREAFLQVLFDYDISAFNLRHVPRTRWLNDQKVLGYKGEELFVFNMLVTGVAPFLDDVDPDGNIVGDGCSIFPDLLRQFYKKVMNIKGPINERSFGSAIKRLCPVWDSGKAVYENGKVQSVIKDGKFSTSNDMKRKLEELRVTLSELEGGMKFTRTEGKVSQVRVLQFPSLKEWREIWDRDHESEDSGDWGEDWESQKWKKSGDVW